MEATTHGLGPFNPAVWFNGRLYVYQASYDNEDAALERSKEIVERMLARCMETLYAARPKSQGERRAKMTQYKLVTATKDGQTKTFQALSRYNDIGWWFTDDIRNGEGTIEEILASHGWAVTKIEDLPDYYVTERREWNVWPQTWLDEEVSTPTPAKADTVVLEISDSVKRFSCRLVVNGVPSQWYGAKANEAVSHDGKYAWFWDYWDGYFPTNTLIELKQHGKGKKV